MNTVLDRPTFTVTLPMTLANLRKSRGLKQTDIARVCEVSPGLVSQWETNAYRPKPYLLDKVASVYGIDRTTLERLIKPVQP